MVFPNGTGLSQLAAGELTPRDRLLSLNWHDICSIIILLDYMDGGVI